MMLMGMLRASAPSSVRTSSIMSSPSEKSPSPCVESRLKADSPSWLLISMSRRVKQKSMDSSVVSSRMVGSFEVLYSCASSCLKKK